jgi:rubredoxin
MEAMHRKLVWFERPDFLGWGCSECGWVFNPSGPPIGESLAEMQTQFEQKRDREFRLHVCAEHPATRPKT